MLLELEEIQCENNEAVYLDACVQFDIGSFQHCTQILNRSYVSLLYTASETAVQPYYELSIYYYIAICILKMVIVACKYLCI